MKPAAPALSQAAPNLPEPSPKHAATETPDATASNNTTFIQLPAAVSQFLDELAMQIPAFAQGIDLKKALLSQIAAATSTAAAENVATTPAALATPVLPANSFAGVNVNKASKASATILDGSSNADSEAGPAVFEGQASSSSGLPATLPIFVVEEPVHVVEESQPPQRFAEEQPEAKRLRPQPYSDSANTPSSATSQQPKQQELQPTPRIEQPQQQVAQGSADLQAENEALKSALQAMQATMAKLAALQQPSCVPDTSCAGQVAPGPVTPMSKKVTFEASPTAAAAAAGSVATAISLTTGASSSIGAQSVQSDSALAGAGLLINNKGGAQMTPPAVLRPQHRQHSKEEVAFCL